MIFALRLDDSDHGWLVGGAQNIYVARGRLSVNSRCLRN
jgi:hypothetical protein